MNTRRVFAYLPHFISLIMDFLFFLFLRLWFFFWWREIKKKKEKNFVMELTDKESNWLFAKNVTREHEE